jgi:hypothetical protein
VNVTLVAVGASIFLFAAAAVDQYLKGGLPVATLYACFAMTNTASLWVTLSQ